MNFGAAYRRLIQDVRHVEWMTIEVLEMLLAALRTRISPKLKRESGPGIKSKVDVYRGVGYQVPAVAVLRENIK